jgi:glycosyltransferase involved in cell wall biosynthesis
VHDVSFLENPEFFSTARTLQLKFTVRRTIARAAKIVTPSKFSRRAIANRYHVSENAIAVIPNGVSPRFRPMPREQAVTHLELRMGIRGPFILNVGDLQPRKNQVGLIRAFEEVIARNPALTHNLVLVGKNNWHGTEVHETARRSPLAHRIRFTGYVEDEDLRLLYNACDAFVFPSFYEGFGIPILEAMACGCPVACSNATAIPEVADAAALLFDPRNASEMARAIEDLLLDPGLRCRMQRLGMQRAALFSWREAARRTLEVYYEVAGAKDASPRGVRSASAVER